MARFMELAKTIHKARGARRDALLAAKKALEAADPVKLVGRAITVDRSLLTAGGIRYDLDAFRKVVVLGAGKASALMATEMERILGDRIEEGLIIIPENQVSLRELRKIGFVKSTHPLPTERGVLAVRKMLRTLARVDDRDLVIFLASGGGSSLMPLPVANVSLEDLRSVTSLLLKSGAKIGEINCVRKHLSQVAGGRLAERTSGAEVISFIISDVVGDDPASVASGPTVPDATTFSMAKQVLERYRIWKSAPAPIRDTIRAGIDERISETPKPGDPMFTRVHNIVVGSNADACAAARASLEEAGYRVEMHEGVTGEARIIGDRLANLAISNLLHGKRAVVAGGETTVTVRGKGTGGRNQELALSAAMVLRNAPGIVLLSFSTDGIDGGTDAAGAVADSTTYERSKKKGLDPVRFLESNDSYAFFESLGDLVITGPTGTNVNDVTIVLKGP